MLYVANKLACDAVLIVTKYAVKDTLKIFLKHTKLHMNTKHLFNYVNNNYNNMHKENFLWKLYSNSCLYLLYTLAMKLILSNFITFYVDNIDPYKTYTIYIVIKYII